MLNKEKIEKEEAQWKTEKDLMQRKQKINEEKKELHKKKFTTTKFLIMFLFINCTVIELFTGWTVVQSLQLAKITGLAPDFSPLVTLIGAAISEIFSFAVYALKATKENTEGGIVYMNAMKDNNIDIDHDGVG
jgi:spore maturation protein SpmA